jgi:aldehyde:ferredoxin oxidoreductase
MSNSINGWCGKILRVDLTRSEISELDTMQYSDFLGGRGIATKIYWDEVSPAVGAFDPENCLILMSGPLGATGAQGASRFEMVGKSPMLQPERFCYGNLGGFFAPVLKRAGYDGIVVTGCAEKPSYIWIHNGRAEIRDAGLLWGKNVRETQKLLQEAHGEKVRFLATGIAGENRCRAATVMTDNEGSVTGGFGAVMGSKKLKAIAVVGSGKPNVADRKKLIELNRYTMKLSERGTLRMPIPKKYMRYVGKASCYQCGLDCLRGTFQTASGREVIRKCHSMVFYMPWVFMTGHGIDDAVDATTVCNDYGICTMEIDNLITWLNACHESGFLTEKDIGLDMSTIGSIEFIEGLVDMISQRIGFGDVLAEGLLRVNERLGEGARAHFNEHMTGIGMGGYYSPREYIPHALIYALEPRQPIAQLHEVSYLIARWLLHRIRPDLSPTTDEVFRAAAVKFWGHEKAWDMTTYEGKAIAAVRIQNRTYMKDSLVLCDAAWPMMDSFNTDDNVGDPSLESRLFTAVTGIDTSEEDLLRYGDRIFNLQRAILLREGWRARDDDAPAEINFTEPVQTDPLNPQLIVPGAGSEPESVRGNVLGRDKFEEMRNEFYLLRGWNPDTGLQRVETLEGLGLSDIAVELERLGLIG